MRTKEKIGILFIGEISNYRSIFNALEYLNCEPIIINTLEKFEKVEKIIVPGVGSFPVAMREIKKYNKTELIEKLQKKHILGICLGMQILGTYGYEFKKVKGLNLINGEVKKIKKLNELPNVGFKKVDFDKNNMLFKNINYGAKFYFTHSFEFLSKNKKNITSSIRVNNKIIISSIEKKNIFGVQFHPEKSSKSGLQLLKNFVNLK